MQTCTSTQSGQGAQQCHRRRRRAVTDRRTVTRQPSGSTGRPLTSTRRSRWSTSTRSRQRRRLADAPPASRSGWPASRYAAASCSRVARPARLAGCDGVHPARGDLAGRGRRQRRRAGRLPDRPPGGARRTGRRPGAGRRDHPDGRQRRPARPDRRGRAPPAAGPSCGSASTWTPPGARSAAAARRRPPLARALAGAAGALAAHGRRPAGFPAGRADVVRGADRRPGRRTAGPAVYGAARSG